jgi:molecular chaperone GrpE
MDKHTKKATDEETEALDDVEFEVETEGEGLADLSKKVAKLKERIKALEAEKQEYLLGWQTARAEFVNLRKRDEAEKKEYAKFSSGRVVEDIIPVLDSFEMAFANTEAWEKVDKNWRVGVEYIYNQLKTVLEGHGVTYLDPFGQTFNVAEHEAAEHIPVDDKEQDHTVIKVIKKGYKLHDKVIRPAQVAVGEYKTS